MNTINVDLLEDLSMHIHQFSSVSRPSAEFSIQLKPDMAIKRPWTKVIEDGENFAPHFPSHNLFSLTIGI